MFAPNCHNITMVQYRLSHQPIQTIAMVCVVLYLGESINEILDGTLPHSLGAVQLELAPLPSTQNSGQRSHRSTSIA